MSTEPLLAPEFLRELEALRKKLEVKARSGASGEHIARARGGSAEFQEHRAYAPGDDLRRVDWLAYARTGEPVVKLFRREEDVLVELLVDASASMSFGQPTKLAVTQRLAAALGYVALAGSQRTQLFVTGNGATADAPRAAGAFARVSPTRRGRGGLPALLRDLSALSGAGRTDLTASLDQLLARAPRPGLLVVFSDFFDSGEVLRALGRARARGHDVALVQVLDRGELDPTLEGDYALEDSESHEVVEMTLDASAVEAYLARLTGLIEELRGFARKNGASYTRVVTDEPLEEAVKRLISRSVD
jgi:uncharacterized protein (DUF58 family)